MAEDNSNDQQQQAANVVPLDKARSAKERAKKPPPPPPGALPQTTGVASFASHTLLLENLRSSGLTDATINAARLFAAPHTEWKRWGFHGHSGTSTCFFPFFEPGGSEPYDYRHRPLRPLVDGKSGKTRKYEQRKNTGLLVYFPPLPGQAVALRDITQPLFITEGEKKGLWLAQLGFATVALTGVSNWHDTEAKEAGQGTRLHPQILRHTVLAGREVVIAYDADARSNEQVMRALQRLAGALTAAGAARVTMCLPPDPKDAKGHDDYGAKYGTEAARNLLLTVREAVDAIEPDLGALPLTHFKALRSAGLDHLRVPPQYEVDDQGRIWKLDPKDPDTRLLVNEAPVLIARTLSDRYTEEYRQDLRFRDASGVWHTASLPRSVTGGRALEPALRRVGGMVTAARVGLLADWLEAFEVCNGQLMDHVQCVHATGWHGRQFMLEQPLLPQREEGDEEEPVQPLALERQPDHDRLFGALRVRAAADVKAHTAALNVALAADPHCAIAICAALAAPLLRRLALPNFAVHLCGESSRGKSSMLRCAASVYGNPNDAAWVASWNSTLTGVEQRAATLCDLPQFYDEAGATDTKHLQTAVYMLVNGEGRTRSQVQLGVRATARWHTVVLSTGEFELADPDSTHTGAQVRVISLPVLGFGNLDGAGVDQLREACAAHAGALGRAWLQWLVDLDDADWLELRSVYEEHHRALRAAASLSSNPLDGRVAGFFAALAVAEAQAADQFGLGQAGGATIHTAFTERLGGDSSARPLVDRVLEALRAWPAMEPGAFPRCRLEPSPVGGEPTRAAPMAQAARQHGWIREDGALLLIPPAAKSYLSERNLPWHPALRRELVARQVLEQAGARGVGITRASVNGQRHEVYALRLADSSTPGSAT